MARNAGAQSPDYEASWLDELRKFRNQAAHESGVTLVEFEEMHKYMFDQNRLKPFLQALPTSER